MNTVLVRNPGHDSAAATFVLITWHIRALDTSVERCVGSPDRSSSSQT